MTDDELKSWLSAGPSRGIHINSNTLNAICNAALTARATPPLSAALKLPEVAALVEAMRGAIEAIDAAYDGPDDNGTYSTRERAALSALDAAKGGE